MKDLMKYHSFFHLIDQNSHCLHHIAKATKRISRYCKKIDVEGKYLKRIFLHWIFNGHVRN